MTDNGKAGTALIAGSIGGVMTMAIHPTGAGSVSAVQVGHLAWMSGVAHSLALVSVLLLVLGAFGLTRMFALPDRLALAALVTFTFSCAAIMIAGTVSGWVIPGILKAMARDVPANTPQWRIAIASIFQINQAMSSVYSVGTALAITLWSVCSLRQRRLSRVIAYWGCVTAPLIAPLLFAGHLRLDVHGMSIVMLSEVVWFIGMGVGLWQHRHDGGLPL